MFKHLWQLGQINRQTELQLLTETPLTIKKKQLSRLLKDVLIGLAYSISLLGAVMLAMFITTITVASQMLQGQRQNLQAFSASDAQYDKFAMTYANSGTFLVNTFVALMIFVILGSLIASIWHQYWHPLLGTLPKQDIRVLKMQAVLNAYTDSQCQITTFFDNVAERREAELKLAQGMQAHAVATVKVAKADYGWAQAVFKELRPEFAWDR